MSMCVCLSLALLPYCPLTRTTHLPLFVPCADGIWVFPLLLCPRCPSVLSHMSHKADLTDTSLSAIATSKPYFSLRCFSCLYRKSLKSRGTIWPQRHLSAPCWSSICLFCLSCPLPSPSPTAFISQTNNPTLPTLHMLFSDHFYLFGALTPCAPSVPVHTLVQLPALENWGHDKIHRASEQHGSRGHTTLTERKDSRHMGIGSALHGVAFLLWQRSN